MDKQRDIYRKLIVKLFKKNFDSALFVEKRDEMMKQSDFDAIRDEIEEEYFVKNRGITPYIKAIKFLQTKIEACTATNTLFACIEDYICAKENVVITKIARDSVEIQTEKENPKTLKRNNPKSKDDEHCETLQAHAECKSPYSCKKCRIMRRLDDGKKVEKSAKKSKQNKVKAETVVPVNESEAESSKLQFSDISDSETTNTSSSYSVDSSPSVAATKNQENIDHQMPYHDHQYSRISFYGSGITEDSSKYDESNEIEIENKESTISQKIPGIGQSLLKPKMKPLPDLLPTHQPYQYKQNNGLRQTAPIYFTQKTTTNTSTITTVQAPTVIRPIPLSIPRPSSSVIVSPYVPMRFHAPITYLQGPVIRQPVYYIRFCEPPKQHQQYFPHNLL